ncbi:NAD(P)-binding Rossmann-fold superfamily protein [Forsythia ovata]|uniref:NAD(P)-binding Rossmann-fold superfamily protein n=1 Tax=Forsythia ovata TaxID=205694 RepID=A0ABD1UD11_9LAMI
MELCRLPRQLPAINLRYRQNSPFRPFQVRCNLLQTTESVESANGQMFILGMGFVGQFFAADLKSKGWVVNGSCTSVEKKTKLEEMGYHAYIFDAKDPQTEILDIMKNHTHLLVSIPPVKGLGDPDGKLQWLTYLSSTSVYGDRGGAWVDEDYPVSPTSEPARARLTAEEEWLCLGHDLGIAAQIFRLGGIYGPGRSAIDTIIKQEPLSKGQKMRLSKQYTSRVHVADICQALNASILKRSQWEIYNIVDDDPAPRMEVFMCAQNLVEQKFPGHLKQHISPEREESLNPNKVSRGEKRVSNARMKKELGVKLFHPTYRSGLQSIIDRMDNPCLQNSPGS